jgi:hypothetical protein
MSRSQVLSPLLRFLQFATGTSRVPVEGFKAVFVVKILADVGKLTPWDLCGKLLGNFF